MTYHLYYVCKDGRCGEYCSEEGREISNRYEISSVGARGMAAGLDGELVPVSSGDEGAYTYGVYTDFDCREEDDAKISGVLCMIDGDYRKYIVACEDGKYRVAMENELH